MDSIINRYSNSFQEYFILFDFFDNFTIYEMVLSIILSSPLFHPDDPHSSYLYLLLFVSDSQAEKLGIIYWSFFSTSLWLLYT